MKQLLKLAVVLVAVCAAASGMCAPKSEYRKLSQIPLGPITTYQVNKLVRDFPEKEDLSTPESAYAAVNRIYADGEEGAWRRLSCKANQDKCPPADAPKRAMDPAVAKMLLNAKIREVHIWRDIAQVYAEWTRDSGKSEIDIRTFMCEDGRWLNRGEGMTDTLEEARKRFESLCRSVIYDREFRPRRTKVADPATYLRPYVDFLKKNAKEPREFVIDALKTHKVVMLGELHGRQIQWQFAQSVVTHPEFAKNVGVIYMEMPMDHQALVDKFLASPRCDPEPVIDTFRDFWEEGWPMQSWLDLFTTVWTVNRSLPQEKRIRIVFVDCRRPWPQIQKRSDWGAYEQESDRDPLMARNILKDRKEHAGDKRNALFIVGFAHASLDFEDTSGRPVTRAGWHLRQALGNKVFSIIPHAPVIHSHADISGRRCLGLFDSAFGEVGNKPMAFPLANSPFGEEMYDASPNERIASRYCDGYSAYLYFGPLEHEISSSMIPTFYTSDFIKEMDRRLKLMRGKGWSEIHGKELTVENVTRRYDYWGKPQSWIGKLGPMDAWKHGDNWESAMKAEKLQYAKAHPEVIIEAAQALLNEIRDTDFAHLSEGDWETFPSGPCDYMVRTNGPGWMSWMRKTFTANPIQSVEVGKTLSWSKWGTPCVEYKLTLKDGDILQGTLPVSYSPKSARWYGLTGLDWHLGKPEQGG